MRRRASIVALALVACAFGYRGEAAFEGSHALGGVLSVRIELPDTPLHVVACDADDVALCPERLRYDGDWVSTGGTRGEAEETALAPTLVFEREGEVAALRAEVPLSAVGLVDLRMGTLELPDDRDLDLRTGIGDVMVEQVEAAVAVDVGVGDVTVRGGAGGVAIRTELGRVEVTTAGIVDVEDDEGDVEIVQTGPARDTFVDAGEGDVRIALAEDGDLDVDIRASGTIRVSTSTIATITSGHFAREVGDGTVRIEVIAWDGDVEVVLEGG
jgi:hypothetical protein